MNMSPTVPADRSARACGLAVRACFAGMLLGVCVFASAAAAPAAFDPAAPEELGFSAQRLQRIDALVERYIEEGEISGAVTLVARDGRVAHWSAQGVMDLEDGRPMEPDTIFRVASMSKPVAAVAVLMLVEEGRVRLTDPVSRFLPGYAALEVAGPDAQPGAEDVDTLPPERGITVLDLLTHTSGLMSGPVSNAAAQAASQRRHELGLAWIEALDGAPLEFQPGSRWSYSALGGFDVLSRIVEIASGRRFDEFLAERIFEPLGMDDTFFWPDRGQRERLVGSYLRREGELVPRPNPDSMSGERYFSGAGGLMTTAYDFARFAMMLAGGGELGDRLLSPRIVELMGSAYIPDSLPGRPPGEGYGLGVRVVTDPVARRSALTAGSFGWSGLYGTHFWVDPEKRLAGVLMIQTPATQMRADFEHAVMQALID